MDQYSDRKYMIGGIVLLAALIMLARLFYLQVIDTSYKLSAENNSRRIEVEYPARGLIYDRNGKLLVYNRPSYDLMIAPFELQAFDSTELCQILDIDIQRLRDGIRNSFVQRWDPFIRQISPEVFGVLQEKLHKFPGFYVKPRTLRKYEHEIASHLLGYVGEVDERIIAADPDYAMGDYIGISGIEKSYEQYLRGRKGLNYYMVDVHSRTIGSYQDSRYDIDAKVGNDIISTIDLELQLYAEKLMRNYKGSIIALEPSTGEVLAFVSAPFYNPSLLVGRPRANNYRALERDPMQPLFMRPLMANYPPGSIFKMVNALIGVERGLINTHTKYYCDLGFSAGRLRVGCHYHQSPLDLPGSIQNSCNAYYCHVFRRILEDPNFPTVTDSYNNWRDHVMSFGLGRSLNTDFTNELRGFIPPSTYYDRYYGKNRWRALTVISLAIGQGEILTTPMQMANMTAVLANRGYYYIPHVVKRIEGVDTIPTRFRVKNVVTIDTSHFVSVIHGMDLAVNGGEGGTARIAKLNNIVVCGKTGTAQNPHGEDHSVFVAFAPMHDPKIAIAVYVEHGKWGSTYAAPISSLLIEKYLTDTITRQWLEKRMLDGNLLY